jgi:hypothetical protein
MLIKVVIDFILFFLLYSIFNIIENNFEIYLSLPKKRLRNKNYSIIFLK